LGGDPCGSLAESSNASMEGARCGGGKLKPEPKALENGKAIVAMREALPSYRTISTPEALAEYCGRLAQFPEVALDTEFVGEQRFEPQLCLVQVAAGSELVLIDALAVPELGLFWQTLVAPGHEVIVHAGRGELAFCYRSTGALPAQVFDVQIAAGMVGIEYPASYGNLLAKVLGVASAKRETRTDWRRRPLSARQIAYALDDIRHLAPLRAALHARLAERGRLGWFAEEMEAWRAEVVASLSEERWRRVSGNTGLEPRSLAILRELWKWRQSVAERRNCPPRRVLRDDLLVELARRQSADIGQIRALRGLERGDLKRQLPRIAAAIQRGLSAAPAELPPAVPSEPAPQLAVLGQFLFSALGTISRQQGISPGLVGTPADVRDWVLYRTGQWPRPDPPLLARGWRATLVGAVLDDLLAGRLALRVADPNADAPLRFEPVEPPAPAGPTPGAD